MPDPIKKPKKRKKKTERKKLIEKLDSSWSKSIRGRDKVCQRCSRTDTLAAAHLHSRVNMSVRWDMHNGVTLCYRCHIHWAHKEVVEFVRFMENRLGLEVFEELVLKKNKPKHWTIDEMKELLETL